MFFNLENVTLNFRQMIKIIKNSPVNTFFLVYAWAHPTALLEGDGPKVLLRSSSETAAGNPNQAPSFSSSSSSSTGPAPSVGAWVFPPGSPRKEHALAYSPEHAGNLSPEVWACHIVIPQPEINTWGKPLSTMSSWSRPWRTSSPTLSSICSWKDWPKCKTNAIFRRLLGGGEEQS